MNRARSGKGTAARLDISRNASWRRLVAPNVTAPPLRHNSRLARRCNSAYSAWNSCSLAAASPCAAEAKSAESVDSKACASRSTQAENCPEATVYDCPRPCRGAVKIGTARRPKEPIPTIDHRCIGSTSRHSSPPPGLLRSVSVPPCLCAMLRAIVSPSPLPPVSRERDVSRR